MAEANLSKLKQEFGKVYDQYVDRIYRFAFLKVSSQEVAEDIASETFLRGWKAVQNPGVEIENVSAFLYQIARNLVTDFYRKKGKVKIVSTENVTIVQSPALHNCDIYKEQVSPLEEVEIEMEMKGVQKALSQIKPDYQDIVIWHYLDELSVPEIAKILDKSEGAVRVQLSRALKALRGAMNGV